MSTQRLSLCPYTSGFSMVWYSINTQIPVFCLCPHTSGLTMDLALYRRFYVHIETHLFFMSTYIRILNGLKFYVHIDTSLLLMFTYIRFDNGLRLLQEVLCPHRNQSVLYRYQSFAQPFILPRKYILYFFPPKFYPRLYVPTLASVTKLLPNEQS